MPAKDKRKQKGTDNQNNKGRTNMNADMNDGISGTSANNSTSPMAFSQGAASCVPTNMYMYMHIPAGQTTDILGQARHVLYDQQQKQQQQQQQQQQQLQFTQQCVPMNSISSMNTNGMTGNGLNITNCSNTSKMNPSLNHTTMNMNNMNNLTNMSDNSMNSNNANQTQYGQQIIQPIDMNPTMGNTNVEKLRTTTTSHKWSVRITKYALAIYRRKARATEHTYEPNESQISQMNEFKQNLQHNNTKVESLNSEIRNCNRKLEEYENTVQNYSDICDGITSSNSETESTINYMMDKLTMLEENQNEIRDKQVKTDEKLVDIQWRSM